MTLVVFKGLTLAAKSEKKQAAGKTRRGRKPATAKTTENVAKTGRNSRNSRII